MTGKMICSWKCYRRSVATEVPSKEFCISFWICNLWSVATEVPSKEGI